MRDFACKKVPTKIPETKRTEGVGVLSIKALRFSLKLHSLTGGVTGNFGWFQLCLIFKTLHPVKAFNSQDELKPEEPTSAGLLMNTGWVVVNSHSNPKKATNDPIILVFWAIHKEISFLPIKAHGVKIKNTYGVFSARPYRMLLAKFYLQMQDIMSL